MTTDERWAQDLRRLVAAVVPPVAVDVERVVPRARRRRAVRRGVGGGAVALVAVLGTAWAFASGAGVADTPPAGVGEATSRPSASPSPGATTLPRALTASPGRVGGVARAVPAEASVGQDGTVTGVPGDPWAGDALYWYVRTELRTTFGDPDGGPFGADAGEDVEHQEWWSSRERPGLLLLDGGLDHAVGRGPADRVGGPVVLDGVRYARLSDPRALPTDPAQLVQAIVDALPSDERAPGDAVFEEVLGALHHGGGLLPRELRDTYWQAAALLPGASLDLGEDGKGRPGEVLRVMADDGTENRLVRDPATGLLLESRSARYDELTVFLEQRTADDVPLAPSLEMLGCTSWATCGR